MAGFINWDNVPLGTKPDAVIAKELNVKGLQILLSGDFRRSHIRPVSYNSSLKVHITFPLQRAPKFSTTQNNTTLTKT